MRISEAEGKFVIIEAQNPSTVCDPQALLACALGTVGVDRHPHFAFEILEDEVHGEQITRWRWVFKAVSRDGAYATAHLVKWWNDLDWLAANPKHEWTLVRTVLMNMAVLAKDAREAIPIAVIRRGPTAAYIPANAEPRRRQWLLDQVDGRIPIGSPFATYEG